MLERQRRTRGCFGSSLGRTSSVRWSVGELTAAPMEGGWGPAWVGRRPPGWDPCASAPGWEREQARPQPPPMPPMHVSAKPVRSISPYEAGVHRGGSLNDREAGRDWDR